MTSKGFQKVILGALLGCATMLTPGPAQALPAPNTNQSVTITYYADTARTVEVGWRQYGDCGDGFDIGVHTRYFAIEIGTCSSDLELRPKLLPLCWNVHGTACNSDRATQSCSDGQFDDYVCTCSSYSWQWQCPELR